MAADAYLLELVEKGGTPPVLRLYGWDRPSITIGYHQKLERAVDLTRLGPTPVVRRFTGGRALVHDDGELTYAMAGNFADCPQLGRTLHDSYHIISQAIVSFYCELGWPARISRRDDPISLSQRTRVQKGCFSSVSQYEILVGDRKVGAGSQRRTKTSFMQHGAIKISVPARHPAIMEIMQPFMNNGIAPLRESRAELEGRLSKAFERIYGALLIPQAFSESERGEIRARECRFENLNSRNLD